MSIHMSTKSKGVVAAMIAVGALGAGTASASAASTYSASASSLSGSLNGTNPAVFTAGNIVVACTTSTSTVGTTATPLSTTPAALPAGPFQMSPRPTFSNCVGRIGGIGKATTVTTSGNWSATLAASPNYTGSFSVPAGGATIVVGTCTVNVGASSVAASLRDASNVIPALGSPASRLGVNGSVNIASYSGTGCPSVTTASFVADGSTVSNGAGGTFVTGTYGLGGTVTEN